MNHVVVHYLYVWLFSKELKFVTGKAEECRFIRDARIA